MNKLFTKIAALSVGLAMAIGVGVAVGSKSEAPREARADTYSLTPNQASTGSSATAYITTLTEFTYSNITWKMNQWNPKTLQVKGNQSSAASEFRFYNETAFSGSITSVVITFGTAGTVAAASKLMFAGNASSAVTSTSGGTAGTWNATNKTLTWTPTSGTNYKYFAFYQNGKAISGTWNLASSDAIVVTYSSSTKTKTTTTIQAAGEKQTLDVTKDPADTVELTATAKAGTTTVTSLASNFTWASSNESAATVSSSGLVTAVGIGKTTITASYKGSDTYDVSSGEIEIDVVDPNSIVYDTTAQGYTNQQAVSSWTSEDDVVSVTFTDGTNPCKYFDTGTSVRVYATGSITISSETKNIVGVTFTFGSGDNSNPITANAGTWVSPSWTGEESSVQFTIGDSTGHRRIMIISISVADKEVIVPTKTTADWKSSTKTVYNGTANNVLSTNDLNVYEKNAEDKTAASHLNGTGFVLKIYKNGTLTYTLDASGDVVQTQSFTGLDPTSPSVVWTVKATVGALTESAALTLNVVAKDTTSLSWTTGYEQTATFVSFAQKLHVDGRITGTFNDGSTSQDYRITTEIYSGNSATAANLIYTRTVTKTTHNNGYDVTAATEQGKTLVVDAGGYLAYEESTTFYVQMYYADYPAYKVGKTISVVIPTLYAEDGNDFNYYVGSEYSTAVKNVSLKNGGSVVKSLNPGDVTLSAATVHPLNTNTITITVTYAATENFDLTTTYTITPKEPATLEAVSFFDNEGSEMGSSGYVMFTAGETFKLFNSATLHESSTYFAYALDSEMNEYFINSYADLKFELFDEMPEDSDVGERITTSTILRPSMDQKIIRGTYTQGSSSVSACYYLFVSNMTIAEYSEGSLADYYQKVTDLSQLNETSYCILAVTISDTTYAFNAVDSNNGYANVTVSNDNKITHNVDTAKLACVVSKVTGGYAIQVSPTSDTHASTFISGTVNSNAINFTEEIRTVTIEETSGRTSTGGLWDIWSNNNKFSFNGNANNLRFRFYKSTAYDTTGYYAVDLYMRAGTPGQGDKITYLKEVIDAYRINSDVKTGDEGFSVCSADSGIYSSDYWKGTNDKVSVKTLFGALTSAELLQLEVQDKFGEEGKTYADTYRMLIDKDPANANSRIPGIFGNVSAETAATTTAIVVVSIVSAAAVGGYFFIRRRKVQ